MKNIKDMVKDLRGNNKGKAFYFLMLVYILIPCLLWVVFFVVQSHTPNPDFSFPTQSKQKVINGVSHETKYIYPYNNLLDFYKPKSNLSYREMYTEIGTLLNWEKFKERYDFEYALYYPRLNLISVYRSDHVMDIHLNTANDTIIGFTYDYLKNNGQDYSHGYYIQEYSRLTKMLHERGSVFTGAMHGTSFIGAKDQRFIYIGAVNASDLVNLTENVNVSMLITEKTFDSITLTVMLESVSMEVYKNYLSYVKELRDSE